MKKAGSIGKTLISKIEPTGQKIKWRALGPVQGYL